MRTRSGGLYHGRLGEWWWVSIFLFRVSLYLFSFVMSGFYDGNISDFMSLGRMWFALSKDSWRWDKSAWLMCSITTQLRRQWNSPKFWFFCLSFRHFSFIIFSYQVLWTSYSVKFTFAWRLTFFLTCCEVECLCFRNEILEGFLKDYVVERSLNLE